MPFEILEDKLKKNWAGEKMEELLKLREGIELQNKYLEPVLEFVNVALEKYGEKIERIILFGAVARGEAKEDSDVDILVVGDVSLEELYELTDR